MNVCDKVDMFDLCFRDRYEPKLSSVKTFLCGSLSPKYLISEFIFVDKQTDK
jgi:hypothetical protein